MCLCVALLLKRTKKNRNYRKLSIVQCVNIDTIREKYFSKHRTSVRLCVECIGADEESSLRRGLSRSVLVRHNANLLATQRRNRTVSFQLRGS